MRKILLGLGVLLLVLSGCSALVAEDPVDYVKPEVVMERIDNKETFSFVIGDATCPACQKYLASTLKEFKKKDEVVLEYIDLDKLTEEEIEVAGELVNQEKYLDGAFSVTPTTYFIVEGKLVDVLEGAVDYDTLSSQFELVK